MNVRELQVSIVGLSGLLCEVEAADHWTVGLLKSTVERATGIPRTAQRLLHDMRTLIDTEHVGHLVSQAVDGRSLQLCLVRRPESQLRMLNLLALMQQPEVLGFLLEQEPEFLADRDVMSLAVATNGMALGLATEELRSDRELVLTAVRQDGRAFIHAATSLKNDVGVMLAAVQQGGCSLGVHSNLGENMQVVMAAIERNPSELEYAAAWIRADREVLRQSVRRNVDVLAYADTSAMSDKEFALEMVSFNGYALEHVDIELSHDMDVVFAAVMRHGNALQFAAPALRNHWQVVLAAVRQNGLAIQHAPLELQSNKAIVLAAVKQNGYCLRHVRCPDMRRSRDVAFAAVLQDKGALRYAEGAARLELESLLHGSRWRLRRKTRIARSFTAFGIRKRFRLRGKTPQAKAFRMFLRRVAAMQ